MHLSSPVSAMRTLPLLLALGCGDVSNAFLLEDAEFLDSLPAESRHTVSIEPVTALPDVEEGWKDHAPRLLVTSFDVSESVNSVILEVLASIDHVRTLRPTVREKDGRRWGPYPHAEGVEIELWNNRSGAGRFDWGADALTAERTLTYLFGTHYAGDSVVAGDGQFTWLLGDSIELLGGVGEGEVLVDYDNRAGIDLVVDIAGVTDGTTPPLTAQYAYRLVDAEGDFQYAYQADINEDGRVEDLAIRTRWETGVGGRADVVVAGGSLEGLTERWTQCWDGDAYLTYEADDLGWLPATGDESACVYAAFAEVDRI